MKLIDYPNRIDEPETTTMVFLGGRTGILGAFLFFVHLLMDSSGYADDTVEDTLSLPLPKDLPTEVPKWGYNRLTADQRLMLLRADYHLSIPKDELHIGMSAGITVTNQ